MPIVPCKTARRKRTHGRDEVLKSLILGFQTCIYNYNLGTEKCFPFSHVEEQYIHIYLYLKAKPQYSFIDARG